MWSSWDSNPGPYGMAALQAGIEPALPQCRPHMNSSSSMVIPPNAPHSLSCSQSLLVPKALLGLHGVWSSASPGIPPHARLCSALSEGGAGAWRTLATRSVPQLRPRKPGLEAGDISVQTLSFLLARGACPVLAQSEPLPQGLHKCDSRFGTGQRVGRGDGTVPGAGFSPGCGRPGGTGKQPGLSHSSRQP